MNKGGFFILNLQLFPNFLIPNCNRGDKISSSRYIFSHILIKWRVTFLLQKERKKERIVSKTGEAYSILFMHLFQTFMNKDLHSDYDPWVIFKQETPGKEN